MLLCLVFAACGCKNKSKDAAASLPVSVSCDVEDCPDDTIRAAWQKAGCISSPLPDSFINTRQITVCGSSSCRVYRLDAAVLAAALGEQYTPNEPFNQLIASIRHYCPGAIIHIFADEQQLETTETAEQLLRMLQDSCPALAGKIAVVEWHRHKNDIIHFENQVSIVALKHW